MIRYNEKNERTAYYKMLLLVVIILLNMSGCKKFVDIDPPETSLTGDNVFRDDATANAVMLGVYTNLSSGALFTGSFVGLSFFPGLSADELTIFKDVIDAPMIQYYTNMLKGTQIADRIEFWSSIYQTIYIVNYTINGLSKSSSLNPSVKKQLMGEALFMRAFCYFYLTNLYGDVPLITSIDYSVNLGMPRSPQKVIYSQIVSDLKSAKESLNPGYVDASGINKSTERVRPNKFAAAALLARVYLFTGMWDEAWREADFVISNAGQYQLEKDLGRVFLKNSVEAIWQLQPVNLGENTSYGSGFVLTRGYNNGINPVYLSPDITDAFEKNDLRKISWIGIDSSTGKKYPFAYKYKQYEYGKPVTEYYMVMRLAEQFLIRSEANLHKGRLTESILDLNKVRRRSGLADIGLITPDGIVNAILQERKVEFFTEWGHRWFDLKRTGKINEVMTSVTSRKGGVWQPYSQLYPISLTELMKTPSISQTPGYN
ncbi:RagB/SusD family nutrient uptake outer membrane protein [Chitinophaga solisilvae]|uniref:RagB/SusD family nutrient uptake outer membrane protein n=1 Tax=Chitinophaga solisilvae TaxID=1233460 RepID=UPI0013694CC6|nr:RagB/SusD family nutrient uptake outer membrane protein [Chitinophaga solisilvae]